MLRIDDLIANKQKIESFKMMKSLKKVINKYNYYINKKSSKMIFLDYVKKFVNEK